MKNLLIVALQGYKKNISPWLPRSCRFVPTCSEYFVEAIKEHGTIKGMGLSFLRILKCNPFSKGGFDPVIKNKEKT